MILKQVTNDTTYISQLYKENIWDPNIDLIRKLNNEPYPAQAPDFINFVGRSKVFFTNANVTVTVYNNNAKQLFTTHKSTIDDIKHNQSNYLYENCLLLLDKYFLSEHIRDYAVRDILKGKALYSLVPRAIIPSSTKNDNNHEMSFVITTIPIIDTSSDVFVVTGMVEIVTDITQQWNNITRLEQRIFAGFLIVFCIFFAIIFYNTNYAQRIIHKQLLSNRRLEEAKIKAEMESASKTAFLANISHELRTPLNAIIGFSEMMAMEVYGKVNNPKYKDYISDINNSGKHLLGVINDILDLSKASSGKLNINKMEVNLNKLAASSMRFVQTRADDAKINLIAKFPDDDVIIKIDPQRLKQALLNLLSNAVKFTPENGSVTLEIVTLRDEAESAYRSYDEEEDYMPQEWVHIIVSDTGIGISDQNIPKALASFGQIDNKLSRKYTGTGLGLPLTKKIIEIMGGKFDLQSTVDLGTIVTIAFKLS